MNLKVVLTSLCIVFITASVPGQARIKGSKVPAAYVDGKTSSGASLPHDLPSPPKVNIVLNDAATNFVLEAYTQNHKDIGWYPKPTFVMVGDVPARSALRYVIKQKGQDKRRE